MTGGTFQQVWMVTGAGRGLGRAYVEAALAAGDRVVATARNTGALPDLLATHPDRLCVLPLDVSDHVAVQEAVARAVDAFGHLDVVVNNAGYGVVGAVEEMDAREARALMETNFFGALSVTRDVLPHFRARRSGHVVQMSSVGGVGTMPFLGLYNASKWALDAFSEALAAEVAGFGIRVTIVEAGGFATDWARTSMRFARPLADYDEARAAALGSAVVPWDTTQPADPSEAHPAEAAAALLAHVKRRDGPLRLLLGADAPVHVRMALERRRDDYRMDPRFTWPE